MLNFQRVPTKIVGPCVFSLHPATFAVPEFLHYETRMVYFVTFGWLHTSFDAICNLVGRCLKGHLWTLDASWTGEVPVWGSHNTAEAIDSQRIRTSWDLRIQLVSLMTHSSGCFSYTKHHQAIDHFRLIKDVMRRRRRRQLEPSIIRSHNLLGFGTVFNLRADSWNDGRLCSPVFDPKNAENSSVGCWWVLFFSCCFQLDSILYHAFYFKVIFGSSSRCHYDDRALQPAFHPPTRVGQNLMWWLRGALPSTKELNDQESETCGSLNRWYLEDCHGKYGLRTHGKYGLGT